MMQTNATFLQFTQFNERHCESNQLKFLEGSRGQIMIQQS